MNYFFMAIPMNVLYLNIAVLADFPVSEVLFPSPYMDKEN